MSKCDGDESRKNSINGTRLNPKCYITDNQQVSLEQRKLQRLNAHKRLVGLRGATLFYKADDIVYALVKTKGFVRIDSA